MRKTLTLVATETEVRLTDPAGVEVARHARSYDRGAVVEDQAHLAALAAKKRRAHDLRGRDRLRASCASADAVLDELARRGEYLGGHVSRLLALLDRFGAAELEVALADALSRGAVGAASVAHLLDQRKRRRREAPPLAVLLSDDPRVRDLRVTPHPLTPYDALGKPEEDPT